MLQQVAQNNCKRRFAPKHASICSLGYYATAGCPACERSFLHLQQSISLPDQRESGHRDTDRGTRVKHRCEISHDLAGMYTGKVVGLKSATAASCRKWCIA